MIIRAQVLPMLQSSPTTIVTGTPPHFLCNELPLLWRGRPFPSMLSRTSLYGSYDIRRVSVAPFGLRRKLQRMFPDKLPHAERPLTRQYAHIIRHPIIAPRAVQVGHRGEMVHKVN